MAQTKEQRKAYNKTYYGANKEQLKTQQKVYQEVNKERIKAYNDTVTRDRNIKKITGDPTKGLYWYNGLLDLQGHVCAVCQDVVEDATGRGQTLHVDHNHETGQARELLCSRCNAAIGYLREREDLCDAVKAYLQKHKRRAIHEERRSFYAVHPPAVA